MHAIEIEGLNVEIEDAGAHALTLHIAAGESVALVGRRQRLLTAIVRACGGLEPIRSGRVRVDGLDIGSARRGELLRLRERVGYVSVGGGLFANMTLVQNLSLPLLYRGLDESAATERAMGLLARARLQDLAHARASTISVELQKLAAYARALAHDPAIVLVEDPAAHLHPEGREIVAQLHRELRDRGATVLLGDDDAELAHRLADRVIDVDDAGRPPRTGATVSPAHLGSGS